MWIFGGEGFPLDGYLNDYGDYDSRNQTNNQLLRFDLLSKTWTNPKCLGAVPSPPKDRWANAISICNITDAVWLYGENGLYELNMTSLTWTHIQTDEPKPRGLHCSSLNVLMNKQLVIHGGIDKYRPNKCCTVGGMSHETWILDLASRTWKQHTDEGCPRSAHTATPGLTNDILIIGGKTCDNKHDGWELATNILHVMLEPKRLQQLALYMVYKHRKKLPLKCLPKKLIRIMDIVDWTQHAVTFVRVWTTFSARYKPNKIISVFCKLCYHYYWFSNCIGIKLDKALREHRQTSLTGADHDHSIVHLLCEPSVTTCTVYYNAWVHSTQLLDSSHFSTRSTQRAQTSLAEADHYSHNAHGKNVEPWWCKTTTPPPPPPPPKIK